MTNRRENSLATGATKIAQTKAKLLAQLAVAQSTRGAGYKGRAVSKVFKDLRAGMLRATKGLA